VSSIVTISARGEERLRAGHLWIYRSDVVDVQASAGDVVRLAGPRKRPLGWAFYSDRSEIAIRLLSTGEAPIDRAWWRARLEAAIAYRASLRIDATAYRLVHGESDLLPSIVIDRYGDHLVLQTLSQGADRLQRQLAGDLVDLLQPAGVLARNDVRVRQLEGLDRRTDVLYGDIPERVAVREGSIEYEVDLRGGQKTGLFLDQRENREAASGYARGRALDCFSYQGGFALHLARRADTVLAVDISADAVRRIGGNAARNGMQNVEPLEANVFDTLRELDRAGERFDTIVLDPPAFAKHKSAVPKALAGYKEINLRALKLLAPDGVLVTCTCSYHVDEATFGMVVFEAAHDARVHVIVAEKRMQSRDHPVLLGVPETYYLKCFILRKVGDRLTAGPMDRERTAPR
jgi:23S rRNA (cytosine1962-C5)-methyltransferase